MLRPHHGVEFVVPSGTPVLAVAAGTVRVAGDDSQIPFGPQTAFYGNLVVLEVAGTGHTPVFALYGHLSEVSVAVGQIVAAGDVPVSYTHLDVYKRQTISPSSTAPANGACRGPRMKRRWSMPAT